MLYRGIIAVCPEILPKHINTAMGDEPRIDECSTSLYRGSDKSLARPGKKQANASVRMA
jgi:hypothetical protein